MSIKPVADCASDDPRVTAGQAACDALTPGLNLAMGRYGYAATMSALMTAFLTLATRRGDVDGAATSLRQAADLLEHPDLNKPAQGSA